MISTPDHTVSKGLPPESFALLRRLSLPCVLSSYPACYPLTQALMGGGGKEHSWYALFVHVLNYPNFLGVRIHLYMYMSVYGDAMDGCITDHLHYIPSC